MLRRIIRRAIRHGYKLGARAAVLPQAGARPGRPRWATPIPSWQAASSASPRCSKAEEERFFETIENGMEILDERRWPRWPSKLFNGETRLQAARHLRLPAGPDRRRLPRAQRHRRRGRLRRRHGPPEGAGARRRQVQDGRQPRIRRCRPPPSTATTASTARGQGAGPATRTARRSTKLEGRPGRRGGARPHPVLRRVRRPGAATSGELRRGAAASSRSKTRRRSRPRCSATTASSKAGKLKVGDQLAGPGRCRAARARHRPQPLGHPPDAQGPARSAGRPRAAEGLAGQPGHDPLRLRHNAPLTAEEIAAKSKRMVNAEILPTPHPGPGDGHGRARRNPAP